MQTAIIYGVGDIVVRQKILSFLNPNIQVVGCSDSYYDSDPYGRLKFIKPKEIGHFLPDYLILTVRNSEFIKDIRKNFLGMQTDPKTVIVAPFWEEDLIENFAYNSVDLYNEKNAQEIVHADSLMMGLSYSYRGIRTTQMNNVIDCSWHGLDLYYNYQILKYMIEEYPFFCLNRLLLVFPYYYLNHDQSKEKHSFQSGEIFVIGEGGDWHNYEFLGEYSQNAIYCYELFKDRVRDVFGEKYYRKRFFGKLTEDSQERISSIWEKEHWHKETIEENTKIFEKYMKLADRISETIYLIIPPFYLDGYDDDEIQAFYDMKKMFFDKTKNVIKKYNIKICDCFELYRGERELFADKTHLNDWGAGKFTAYLNQMLED